MNPTSPTEKQAHLVWHPSETSCTDRRAVLKQRGCVLWLTGLSGSGKSTLAHALEKVLVDRGQAAYVLDGDNIRHGLNRDLGFSPEDRSENLRRIAEVARLFSDSGVICISAFISPYRSVRQAAREIIGEQRFKEVYVSTSLQECERRDVKGMYAKARAGTIAEFTGVSSPYEPPENPDYTVDTTGRELDECIAGLVAWLRESGMLGLQDMYTI